VIPNPERAEFFKKIHLFHDLAEADLARMAEIVDEKVYKAGEIIIQQGSREDGFFIIYSGKVEVTRRRDKRVETLAALVPQDYFGEEELASKRPRTATVTALTETRVFILTRPTWLNCSNAIPN